MLVYHYDEAGMMYGFTVADSTTTTDYYYIHNLQGDVIQIVDSTGTVVVYYTYDPWGETLSIEGTLATTLGATNPIRYRGYYYDTETGFYYCRARYYDPEICRWINADTIVSRIGGSIAGNVVGASVAGGGDFMILPDEELNTEYYGVTLNLGVGTPGAEFHIEWGKTFTLDMFSFNIYEEFEKAYIEIMES